MKSIYIVGGGFSLRNFNLRKLSDKVTIGVNKSIFFIPNPNYFITMDNSLFNKFTKRENKYYDQLNLKKIFIANFASGHLIKEDDKIIDKRWNIIYQLERFDKVIESYKTKGFGLSYDDFRNGDNSGHCAIQYAILLGYKKINLLGFDFTVQKNRKTHFHGGYAQSRSLFIKNLEKYYQNLLEGIKELKEKQFDITIYNCNKNIKLDNLLPYKEL